jgi:hypothetical protein
VFSYLISCISKTHCYANRPVLMTISYSFEEVRQCHIVIKWIQLHVQLNLVILTLICATVCL